MRFTNADTELHQCKCGSNNKIKQPFHSTCDGTGMWQGEIKHEHHQLLEKDEWLKCLHLLLFKKKSIIINELATNLITLIGQIWHFTFLEVQQNKTLHFFSLLNVNYPGKIIVSILFWVDFKRFIFKNLSIWYRI